jgi:hypothetical protein
MTLRGMFRGGKRADRYEIIGSLFAMIPINCKTFITERDIAAKCADCNCSSDECQSSVSSFQYPNCTLEECCCWLTMQSVRNQ